MALLLAETLDRYRATVLGFAVGDALGFPFRGLPPQARARLGMADDFALRPRGRFAKGQFSDDTQVLLAVAESVARECSCSASQTPSARRCRLARMAA